MKALVLVSILGLFLSSCTSLPLKKVSVDKAEPLEVGLVGGNKNIELYRTQSRVKVYENTAKGKSKLMENRLERGEFRVHRDAVLVNDQDQSHLRYYVTDKKGEVDLLDMALPPEGKQLIEVIDKRAKVLAVKGFPDGTIFYIPRISLPDGNVSPGDSWEFKGRWRALDTGWPFEVVATSKLESWVKCGRLRCAYITYVGKIVIPKDSPISKGGKLKSKLKGKVLYAPIGHQFLWAESSSSEVFATDKKKIEVEGCTVSYQESPTNFEDISSFQKRMKSICF